jgi:hypothetical protein
VLVKLGGRILIPSICIERRQCFLANIEQELEAYKHTYMYKFVFFNTHKHTCKHAPSNATGAVPLAAQHALPTATAASLEGCHTFVRSMLLEKA